MNIRQEQDGNTVVITLEGSLDAVHAPTFEATCREFLNNCPKYIILDGTHWDFVSEAGLQTLLTLLKELKGRSMVALVHPTPLVKQIFGISGLSECFTYHETLEEAKKALGKQ
jgi:anti-anti-sigma factor